jgi:hypothetical protein
MVNREKISEQTLAQNLCFIKRVFLCRQRFNSSYSPHQKPLENYIKKTVDKI